MTLDQATKELKKINKGLFVDTKDGYYVIKFKDDRNGLVRTVRNVLDEEGKPAELKMDQMKDICRCIDWGNVSKYSEPSAMSDAFEKELELKKTQARLEQQGFLLDMAKDRKRQWKEAYDEFRNNLTPRQVRAMKKEMERREYLKQMNKKGIIIL